MNQSEFLEITCNLLEVWEKSQVKSAISFCFASLWLKTCAKLLSRSLSVANNYCNSVITFNSHFKTALIALIPNEKLQYSRLSDFVLFIKIAGITALCMS